MDAQFETGLESVLGNLSEEQASRAWFLSHGLDSRLEFCQQKGMDIEASLLEIMPWICSSLGAKAVGVRVELKHRPAFYASFGKEEELVDFLLRTGESGLFEDTGGCLVGLDVNGDSIGFVGATYPVESISYDDAINLKVVAEELDTLFYELIRIENNRWQSMQLQSIMCASVLRDAISNASVMLKMETGLKKLLIIHTELSLASPVKTGYIFQPGKPVRTLLPETVSTLWELAKLKGSSDEEIRSLTGMEGEVLLQVPIVSGLSTKDKEGIVLATGDPCLSLKSGEELMRMFAAILGQRLVDYHKEQRYLQQYFNVPTVTRLLMDEDYLVNHLYPSMHDIGMVYSDITSFTKISEKILAGPAEVCELIDYWSAGVFKIIFDHGGAVDKMVGDCIIGLFGPPFYDFSPSECCRKAIECGLAINTYTESMTGNDVIDKIRTSSIIPGLGVATGVNYGAVMVGTVSPNMDYTAFGKHMNNCARLQGVAGFREVLAMSHIKNVIEADKDSDPFEVVWGEKDHEAVKNVENPLEFYRVKLP